MREIAKEMVSFSWAMSLFGVKRLTDMMMPGGAAETKPGNGNGGAAADDLPDPADAANPGKMAMMLMPPLVTSISLVVPGQDSKIVWREVNNKLAVMELVAGLKEKVGIVEGSYKPLPELV